eukprot:s1359_g9.t1
MRNKALRKKCEASEGLFKAIGLPIQKEIFFQRTCAAQAEILQQLKTAAEQRAAAQEACDPQAWRLAAWFDFLWQTWRLVTPTSLSCGRRHLRRLAGSGATLVSVVAGRVALTAGHGRHTAPVEIQSVFLGGRGQSPRSPATVIETFGKRPRLGKQKPRKVEDVTVVPRRRGEGRLPPAKAWTRADEAGSACGWEGKRFWGLPWSVSSRLGRHGRRASLLFPVPTASVALGDIHVTFVWHARHLALGSAVVTLGWRLVTVTPRLSCLAGVTLGDGCFTFVWQAWHWVASSPFRVAGMAPTALG